jgi:hypothetical protein
MVAFQRTGKPATGFQLEAGVFVALHGSGSGTQMVATGLVGAGLSALLPDAVERRNRRRTMLSA